MAENTFRSNSRSPRYSTNRASGFTGGARALDGNIAQPSARNVAGPADSSFTPPAPAIAGFSTQGYNTPRPPGLGQQIASGAASQVAGSALKSGAQSLFGSSDKTVAGGTDETVGTGGFGGVGTDEAAGLDVGDEAAGGFFENAGGDAGGAIGDAAAGSFADGFGGWATDEAAGAIGEEVAGGIIGDAVGGSVPVVGPLIRLAQGDAKGAAGSAIGGAIGSVFGPIGTAVGSFLGGAIGGSCFITEAVMTAQGMDDNSEPLQILRAFRDNIMMKTPEGQAMVQEYEQIAPVIVEAIGAREDALQIYQQIYAQFIAPAVEMIKAGDYKGALEIYAKMVAFAASFSEEVLQGDEEAMAGVSALGDTAAMVSHDDDMTAMIGGQGVGDADWAQNDQPPQNDAEMAAISQMGARRF